MARVDPFDATPLPGVTPRQAAGWTKYRLKTRAAVEEDKYAAAYLEAISQGSYRDGLSKFWGVSPGPRTVAAYKGAASEATERWNKEFETRPARSHNANKWLDGSRHGIQK